MRSVSTTISRLIVPAFVLAGLIVAFIGYSSGHAAFAEDTLLTVLVVGSLPLLLDILQAIRTGHFGVDIIAIVAIGASLFLRQYLAGTVILLMLSGGEALEEYALKRARKELTDLFSRAPEVAHKQDGAMLRDVPVGEIQIGDTVIVKPGETVPVDGQVMSGSAMVDESALTGESMPVKKSEGQKVFSGTIATDALLTIRALALSSESKYAKIIRLVQEAEEHKAPFVRLADQYSVVFTSITFILAVLAWFLSHDPLRLLAVLVVATPCPLILATPIAFAAGISHAAKRGIIIRNGGALEKLGQARSFIFDKTGTLTLGVPSMSAIQPLGIEEGKAFLIAASLDQLSAHILARSLFQESIRRGVALLQPQDFQEKFGEGVSGSIDGKRYLLGRLSYLRMQGVVVTQEQEAMHSRAQEQGQITVYLAEGTALVATIFFADQVRKNVKYLFSNIRALGIRQVRMLTGDRRSVALRIGEEIGLKDNEIFAECLPEDKVREVRKLHKEQGPVVMVGDGVNDAPALAAADIGIAMGAHGDTAASQAGDVVIMVDEIERVGEALFIVHRVLGIAKQSIFIGIGCSIGLMVFAAFGFIPPVLGAMLQEAIDVLVILNALRVLLVKSELYSS